MPILTAILTTALILMSSGALSQTAGQAVHDMKDREFSAREVIEALRVPTQSEAGAGGANAGGSVRPTRRIRGLAVVPAEKGVETVAAGAGASTPRRLSMQLQFGLDSADVMENARSRLDALGAALQSPELVASSFVISGHTDSTGRYAYNVALSKRRAVAVRSYLLARYTISPERLLAVGKGPDELLDPSNPRSPTNRRVQVETMR